VVVPLCREFLRGLQACLGRKLVGVYIYGAITFPETGAAIHDVDFHAIVADALIDAEQDSVVRLLESLRREFPPLGGELDGYMITLADACKTTPPTNQLWPRSKAQRDESWALHCAHIRAGRRIVLFGPDSDTIYPQPSERDIEEALGGELQYVAERLEVDPAYCVLNLCRLMYSYQTKNVVVSKQASAQWALDELDKKWHALIEAARRSYRRSRAPGDSGMLHGEVRAFFETAQRQIATSLGAWREEQHR